jgi:Glycosyltransferase (GlcNAc)
LLDLINRAKKPDLLRIVVCWQHAPDETLAEFWRQGFGKWRMEKTDDWTIQFLGYRDARIELIDVPYLKTQGACWARNLLQQRFVDAWDTLAIDMLEALRDESPKPVLTAYLPGYEPKNDTVLRGSPQILGFNRFGMEGVVLFRGRSLPDWQTHSRPVRSRFYSGHFAFADGHFAEVVQHDPDYFFLGEEISIAVRAFTHGYDLYHPHCLIAWHEYTRQHSVKMWDDHTDQAKEKGEIEQPWGERSARAYRRNCALLGVDGTTSAQEDFGKYGLGTERTLAEYEAYAGISFALRGVQQATLDHQLPVPHAPRPDEAAWKASLLRANDVRVCLHQNVFDERAVTPGTRFTLSSATSAAVVVYDGSGTAMHRETVDTGGLSQHRKNDWLDFRLSFVSELERIPAWYVVELLDDAGNLLSRLRHDITA